jgi:autotransporter-associated beta strand protein
VNTTGDITATRFVGTGAPRTITKNGAGTLTTSGSGHNNLTAWQINQGSVVFANTGGYGADRGVTIEGGTLRLGGTNSDLVNDGQAFTINSGSFDLNGKSEAVASIGGTGGTVTNSASSTISTLYVGGGVSGTSSATFAGVIENGAGTMKLTKEGTGTQTLTGTNTYTGATSINNGTLALGATGSIDNTSGVSLGAGGTFDVSAKTGGYTVSDLSGSGNVVGSLTVSTQLSIGNSPGTTTFDNLALGGSSTYFYELTGGGITADLGLVEGNLTLGSGALLDLFQLGTYTANDKFTLFAYTGILSGAFSGLADGSTFTDAGGVWRIDYNDTSAGLNGGTLSGASYITVAAVPEQRAALIGGIGMLALLRRRRIK